MRFARAFAVVALGLGLAACSGDDVEPADLPDPCPLITDDMLARLAPGGTREPAENLGARSGTRECNVDLTAGDGFRGDLGVTVEADSSGSEKTRTAQCERIGATLGEDGPGDRSCFAVRPWDGSQSRIDGWAFVGDHYAARVGYQLVDPQQLPAGAEQDLRGLLDAATAGLPTG